MLTKAKKGEILKSLREDIEGARAMFLTNLIGVTSNDSVAIRKNIREAGGKIIVTRNTLFAKAAEGTKAESLFKDLKGPHAVAFAFEDAPAVAKVLKNASKDHEEFITLKAGMLGDEELAPEKVQALADLPSRDEMLGTLLATFNAPISALARVLFAIQEKKEEGGGEVVEAAAEAEAAPETTEE
jgi:large subunit ribosomal protein L10